MRSIEQKLAKALLRLHRETLHNPKVREAMAEGREVGFIADLESEVATALADQYDANAGERHVEA